MGISLSHDDLPIPLNRIWSPLLYPGCATEA
jgi:hypothetical protein